MFLRSSLCVLFLVSCAGDAADGADSEKSKAKDEKAASAASAGTPNADITNVYAREEKDGTWTFHVSVKHPDVGFDDFADGWDLVTGGGKVIKPDPRARFTKIVRRPHVDEQPFTRTVKGVVIPDGVDELTVRAHDSRAGFGGEEVRVDLKQRFGKNFSVKRAL